MSDKDVDFYYRRTWTCIREGRGLLSQKDVDLYQRRTWTCIRAGLVSNLDQIIAIIVAILVVLRIHIFTEQICVTRKLQTCMRRGLVHIWFISLGMVVEAIAVLLRLL